MGKKEIDIQTGDREYWDARAVTPPFDKAPDARNNNPTVVTSGNGDSVYGLQPDGDPGGRQGGRHG